MKYGKLQTLTDEALVHRELQLERDLIAASFLHRTGQLDDASQLGKLRKDIARARTAQRERELAQGLPGNSLREKFRASFRPGAAASEVGAPKGPGFLKGLAGKLGLGGSSPSQEGSQEGAGE